MKKAREEEECPRQRSTWRLSNSNFDWVQDEAARLGVSMNGALNVLLAEARPAHRHRGGRMTAKDSKVTAKLETGKAVH
jgi:hypothetical protein